MYPRLVLWGVIQGSVAAVFEMEWMRITDPATLILTVLAGGGSAALVFGLLRRRPPLRWLGFLLVSTLIPLITVMGSASIFYGRLTFVLDPLAIVVALIWALTLMPFALVTGLLLLRLG